MYGTILPLPYLVLKTAACLNPVLLIISLPDILQMLTGGSSSRPENLNTSKIQQLSYIKFKATRLPF